MAERPLVSVIVPTRNRGEELERTLGILRRQTYLPLEVIVVDDASDHSLEALVRRVWPGALFWRKEKNAGQCLCRNEAFEVANGSYLLSLDDDSCFTQATDLERAVSCMESRPEVGVLTFYTFHGLELPPSMPKSISAERFMHTFLAGASMVRRAVIAHTGGYLTSFGNEGEEEELSLRILDAGWGILFFPGILIHHRVSPLSRNSERTWERGLRNKLWLILLHMPRRRVPVELCWKLGVGLWDAFRLRRFRRFFRSVGQFLTGMPAILRIRKPISALTLRRYDAIRFRGVCTAMEYADPPACRIRDLANWYGKSWRNRPRNRSFWDHRAGDVGVTSAGTFAHEFAEDKRGKSPAV